MDLLRTSIFTERAKSRFLALRGRWPLYSRAITAERISILEFEPRDQFEQRQKKLEQIQALGFDPFPREFRWTDSPAALVDKFSATPGPDLEANKREVRVAGRLVSYRLMGKAGFAHLQGAGKRIQIYVKKDVVGERGFQLFHLLDLGDSIGVRGHLFRTRTDELSIWVEELFFLSKALLPLPEKWHGLTDVELRYRQRYLDLIANDKSRQVFVTRARIIQELRRLFDARGYIEVETPMMHPIPGGAAARPFVTHHNTLDIDLYLRIAPELYLKRLTVGGFDRVYEINRNFRNEGISTQHNPEFTMLEFYEAYSNYRDLMDLNEQLFAEVAKTHHRFDDCEIRRRGAEFRQNGAPVDARGHWQVLASGRRRGADGERSGGTGWCACRGRNATTYGGRRPARRMPPQRAYLATANGRACFSRRWRSITWSSRPFFTTFRPTFLLCPNKNRMTPH